ncbi:MAG TPA: GrpB family protein [Staphylococcus kloosii]|uniref:GrpB family protein n=1 Tax=Staphylococcus kloosii TaxID=29384 RepID=A0A921KVY5_9STAP|nr:GrpB family protein [Staphylococcus kloosii]HJF68075.1 GrpB family protein [Staphylococcus kloosii]
MYSNVQPLITASNNPDFKRQYKEIQAVLFNLLDSPVKSTYHIGGTSHFNYPTEPVLDILVGVNNLHDITDLDEKRLNYEGFYRLHHSYKKKVIMAKFNNLIELKQVVRLHILQQDSDLFEQYLTVNDYLSSDQNVAMSFAQRKQEILNNVETIRAYENQKQQVFSTLYKQIPKK